MRLIITLLAVLVLVIAVVCYRHAEYFTSVQDDRCATRDPKPVIGNTVTCGIDMPNGKGKGALYQYTSNTVLDWYPDVNSALVYDICSRTPKKIADCSKFKLGATLNHASKVPDTTVGHASGPNGSYGTLNQPGAQLGTGAAPYDPVTGSTYPKTSGRSAGSYGPLNQPTTPLDTVTGLYDPDNDAAPYNPINQPTNTIQPLPSGAAKPVRTDVTPRVSVSDTSYTAMELQNKSELLKEIQTIIRQEVLANRNQPKNHPLAMGNRGSKKPNRKSVAHDDNDSCDEDDNTDSVQQGSEYKRGKEDMSQYIKKNAIPCWGCSLDY